MYETQSAAAVVDRVDSFDLVNPTSASSITLECRGRNDHGYAVFEVEAMGSQVQSEGM